jgi:hypothetical protein
MTIDLLAIFKVSVALMVMIALTLAAVHLSRQKQIPRSAQASFVIAI